VNIAWILGAGGQILVNVQILAIAHILGNQEPVPNSGQRAVPNLGTQDTFDNPYSDPYSHSANEFSGDLESTASGAGTSSHRGLRGVPPRRSRQATRNILSRPPVPANLAQNRPVLILVMPKGRFTGR
jgi:hypothetical protein